MAFVRIHAFRKKCKTYENNKRICFKGCGANFRSFDNKAHSPVEHGVLIVLAD